MGRSAFCLAFALLAAGTLPAAAVPASTVVLPVTGGWVRGGVMGDGSIVFRGLPYAAAPVGDLRWKPPAPFAPWSGIRDATAPPAPCLQRDEGWNTEYAQSSNEDCLYLSLHAPAHKPGERLPVVFWIHGGANRVGAGYPYVDSGIYLQRVLVVAPEFRLGVFGFLGSPELSAESQRSASGNYALMDLITALWWVRANIATFGGDPNNVTIAGQSSGASDVGLLLASPLARGLFHKAIEESGVAGFGVATRSQADNEQIGRDLLNVMGAPSGPDGLRALRTAKAEDVLMSAEKITPPKGIAVHFVWEQASIDGWIIPAAPSDVFAHHEQAPVPLLIGNNTREMSREDADPGRLISNVFGHKSAQALPLYGFRGGKYVGGSPTLGNAATQFGTDLGYRCPANRMADWQAGAGQTVWRYQFGIPAPDANGILGHNAELPYIFDDPPKHPSFASWPPLQQYWANFARTGDPNGRGLPYWPAMGKSAEYIDFTPRGPMRGHDLRGPICRLLYKK